MVMVTVTVVMVMVTVMVMVMATAYHADRNTTIFFNKTLDFFNF
jgi:hypothetical protein